jgi:hypothetical protein
MQLLKYVQYLLTFKSKIFIKCFKNSILLSGSNRFLLRPSYLFSLLTYFIHMTPNVIETFDVKIIETVKGQNNFWNRILFQLVPRAIYQILYIRTIQIGKNNWDLETHRKSQYVNNFCWEISNLGIQNCWIFYWLLNKWSDS